jgi:hypothetical protein
MNPDCYWYGRATSPCSDALRGSPSALVRASFVATAVPFEIVAQRNPTRLSPRNHPGSLARSNIYQHCCCRFARLETFKRKSPPSRCFDGVETTNTLPQRGLSCALFWLYEPIVKLVKLAQLSFYNFTITVLDKDRVELSQLRCAETRPDKKARSHLYPCDFLEL